MVFNFLNNSFDCFSWFTVSFISLKYVRMSVCHLSSSVYH